MSHETFTAPAIEHLAELLPAYDFEAFIAQGGMGAVFKAVQRSLERDVAIKILPRELGADPEFRSSFETEAKAMARLNHPNLIGVYDFGDVDGMPYIVMEYVNGKSLYHSAWNSVVAPDQAVQIVRGICEGLAHAHENGVIHRDIKPANILLTPKAEPKIGDFGLAQPAGENGPGLVMGTPGYSAPEFLAHPDRADKRSDIFAVGVIFHELLTGQRPDPEGQEAPMSTGDPGLDAIWQKAVHPNPAFRYHDASAMAWDLAAWTPTGHATPQAPATSALPRPPGPTTIYSPSVRPAVPGRSIPLRAAAVPAGSKSTLARNLVIIAVLIAAIFLTQKTLEETKAERAATIAHQKQEQADLERQQAEELAAREKEALAAASNAEPKTLPEAEPETALESLARLRTALAEGVRSEFPVGAIRHGASSYFLVEDAMTWHQAAAFAEDHGAHLAVINSEDDIIRLTASVPKDSSVWIGAGRVGAGNWLSVDGTRWSLSKEPGGVGEFAALSDLGILRARKSAEAFPFVIQWQLDGSNQATLAAMLDRARNSLGHTTPLFPPGTFSFDGRHFAAIIRPLDRGAAQELAMQAGGVLAVPATRSESDGIIARCEEFQAPDGLWLGGRKSGAKWQWDSGEPWNFAPWADESAHDPANHALVLVPGLGWKDADPSAPASGVLIEWSGDGKGDPTPVQPSPPETAEKSEIDIMATRLVETGILERDQELAKNAKDFAFELDIWVGRLRGNESARWAPHVAKLKTLIVDHRVPEASTFDATSGIALSPEMAKACEHRLGKQREIEAAFRASMARLRDAYVLKLKEPAEEARAAGQVALARQLDEKITAAANLEGWIASHSGASVASGSGNPLLGVWVWADGTRLGIYPDAILKSTSGNRGTWTALEGADYTLSWIRPSDGATWDETITLQADQASFTSQEGNVLAFKDPDQANPEVLALINDGDDPIVGEWYWGRARIIIRADGLFLNDGIPGGTWKLDSEETGRRTYLVTWEDGKWIDTVTLDKDGRMMDGSNQNGDSIRAVKFETP